MDVVQPGPLLLHLRVLAVFKVHVEEVALSPFAFREQHVHLPRKKITAVSDFDSHGTLRTRRGYPRNPKMGSSCRGFGVVVVILLPRLNRHQRAIQRVDDSEIRVAMVAGGSLTGDAIE